MEPLQYKEKHMTDQRQEDTRIVTIDLNDRSYDIFIGENLLERLADFIPINIEGAKVFIVTDTKVEPYAKNVKARLSALGARFCEVYVLPNGEATKSYDRLIELHQWMLKNGINRDSIIFAVGGGVIGDLAGFAASTILRGVPYIQIPTTLLSQVDSSVGGKTGINTKYGKNLVGNFYQPSAVIADTHSLNTLPKRELLAGYAEVVKYALINNVTFFEWLQKNGVALCSLDHQALSYAIEVCCQEKARIVELDEKEEGNRALLNLGHTFGHALEAVAGYDGKLLHGEAVAIGTVMAFALSVRMGLCSQQDAEKVEEHFKNVGLPTHVAYLENEFKTSVEDILEIMKRDKKVIDNKMTFILVRGIGEAFITRDVTEDSVRAVLEMSLGKKEDLGK